MSFKLDDKDLSILALIQEDSKLTANQMAKKINIPITTVFAKIKRMEELGIIKQYRAILSAEKLNLTTAAFILAAVSYGSKVEGTLITQREVAEEIACFVEVQEVHVIAGDWDLLIKIRAENVNDVGKFVVDKLRRINGLQKTLTCMVFETVKETTSLPRIVKKQLV
ncbi:MAG: Lrp/AsnC family transcriptional regulator [Nitrososphaerota archaeon]|jgi:DNA-binding Lrp family transcriptional regulator|nr:Lrp/AsnC family transcriptional regulator [Nitrososphaerota archaeon]